MTYYNKQKVKEILKMYHHYSLLINSYKKEYASVGVTVYSEEAVMPRANTISDVTANEAIKHHEDIKYTADAKTDLKYVNDRLHRVSKELEHTLELTILGYDVNEISHIKACSKRKIYKELDKISAQICNFI